MKINRYITRSITRLAGTLAQINPSHQYRSTLHENNGEKLERAEIKWPQNPSSAAQNKICSAILLRMSSPKAWHERRCKKSNLTRQKGQTRDLKYDCDRQPEIASSNILTSKRKKRDAASTS
jgi:hypothetical protein